MAERMTGAALHWRRKTLVVSYLATESRVNAVDPPHRSCRMSFAAQAFCRDRSLWKRGFLRERDLGFEAVMRDWMNLLVLICAALASLGFGVILAYAVCRGGFALLRLQAPRGEASAAPAKAQTIEA
jgi:hypothetical protein